MAKSDIAKLGQDVAWQDVTRGNTIVGCGTTKEFITGDWTSVAPVIDEEKCKQCLLCVPVCPDSCIPVKDYKRQAIDYDIVRDAICIKACPFNAIKMEK
ncbi:MAG: 4Fe-4S binding protein [Eubacterium sp.]